MVEGRHSRDSLEKTTLDLNSCLGFGDSQTFTTSFWYSLGFGIRDSQTFTTPVWYSFGIRFGIRKTFTTPFWYSLGFGIRSFLQLPFGIRFGIRSTFTNSDGQLHMESTTPVSALPIPMGIAGCSPATSEWNHAPWISTDF